MLSVNRNKEYTLYMVSVLLLFIYLFFGSAACRILFLWPRMEPVPFAVEAWNLNHWTTREVSILLHCWGLYYGPGYSLIYMFQGYLKRLYILLLLGKYSISVNYMWSFPGGSNGKESTYLCRKLQETQVQFPGLGRSPGGGNGNPLQ